VSAIGFLAGIEKGLMVAEVIGLDAVDKVGFAEVRDADQLGEGRGRLLASVAGATGLPWLSRSIRNSTTSGVNV
jgi:hypothetical protein